MATTKEQKERKEKIFKYLLKKSGVSYTEFLTVMKHNFIASNLDLLSKSEKKMLKVNE